MHNKTLQEEPKGKTTAEKKKAFAKYTVKDSVFSTIFQDKKYLIELYRALHPEDTETTEDALTDITIRNVQFQNRKYTSYLQESVPAGRKPFRFPKNFSVGRNVPLK